MLKPSNPQTVFLGLTCPWSKRHHRLSISNDHHFLSRKVAQQLILWQWRTKSCSRGLAGHRATVYKHRYERIRSLIKYHRMRSTSKLMTIKLTGLRNKCTKEQNPQYKRLQEPARHRLTVLWVDIQNLLLANSLETSSSLERGRRRFHFSARLKQQQGTGRQKFIAARALPTFLPLMSKKATL